VGQGLSLAINASLSSVSLCADVLPAAKALIIALAQRSSTCKDTEQMPEVLAQQCQQIESQGTDHGNGAVQQHL